MSKLRFWIALSPLALALAAPSDADADAVTPPDLLTSRASTTPPLTLPPEPPLPAGCTKPTAENCADSTWLAGDACAKDPAKAAAIRTLCNWTLLKAWNDANANINPTMFPKSAPNSVSPPPLLTPAQRVEHGKLLTAQPSSRPGEKRRFPGAAPHGQIGVRVPSPSKLAFTPKTATAGGGSYGTIATPHVVGSLDPIHSALGGVRGVPAKGFNTNTGALQKVNGVATLLKEQPQFVSNGDAVTSCEDYAYKRWGDYSRYSFAAKRLGRNYRQIYAIATDPRSPTFLNKKTLNQIGSGAMPRQIGDMFKSLPPNAFIAGGAGWLDSSASTSDAKGRPLLTDLQRATIKALLGQPHPLQARTDTSPLGVHREMKAVLDKYDPLDEELDDIAKRSAIYLNLLNQRASMTVEYLCTGPGDPCHRCTPWPAPPQTMPVGLQGLKDKVIGPAVIDPADLKDRFRGDSKYGFLSELRQMQAVQGTLTNLRGGMTSAGGGMKQKGAPVLGQIPKAGGPQVTPPRPQPQFPNATQQCFNDLGTKHAQIHNAMTEIERQLTRLLVNELAFGDRGCLADPRGAIGNMCDWSYQEFALATETMFDADVERDFQECRAHIVASVAEVAPATPVRSQFPLIAKNADNQRHVFPCTQRRDFSTNAASFFTMIGLENEEWHGRGCEAMRQQSTIDASQRAIIDQMTGIQWDPGGARFYDSKNDTHKLGDPATLAASFTYDSYWEMAKTGAPKGGDLMQSCQFSGQAHSRADATIHFFGSDLHLATLSGETSTLPRPNVSINAAYLDIDTMSMKQLTPEQKNRPLAPGEQYTVALADPPVNLGGVEYSFWFTIGPIPMKVTFGAVATAGVDYELAATAGDNCADLAQSSNFKLAAHAKPYVRADAYADAEVDVGVASAGVRLDLNLMNLSLPIGVNVTSAADGYELKNGGSVDIDMLAGHLSAYAQVGVSPFDVSYDAEIFGWDGFHTSVPIFGLTRKLSQNVVRIAMAGRATSDNVSCKYDASTNTSCSNVSCNVAACMPGSKVIGGTRYTCSFSDADIAAMKDGWWCRTYVR